MRHHCYTVLVIHEEPFPPSEDDSREKDRTRSAQGPKGNSSNKKAKKQGVAVSTFENNGDNGIGG